MEKFVEFKDKTRHIAVIPSKVAVIYKVLEVRRERGSREYEPVAVIGMDNGTECRVCLPIDEVLKKLNAALEPDPTLHPA